MPRLTKQRHIEMMDDYKNGMPLRQIADKYGVHITAASKAASRAGTTLRQSSQPLALHRASKRKCQTDNPEKRKAHKAVEYAIATGALTKSPCERCGSENSHAHHEDYNKPLDVMWLCPTDHKKRHREIKEAGFPTA